MRKRISSSYRDPRESKGPEPAPGLNRGATARRLPSVPAFAGMTNSALGEIGDSSSGRSLKKKVWHCRYPLAVALAVAGCAPGAAEYTKAEAPDQLQVDGGTSSVVVSFAPGASRLSAASASQIDRLVASGAIRPPDRVTVAAAGPPGLAAAREAAVAHELLRWGIVAEAQPLPAMASNNAIVTIGRYAVRLPPCPNWSQPRANDFTNAPPSNFGCATAVNLGLMVARPADLITAQNLGPAAGQPAAAAVSRYLIDQVPLPNLVAIGPLTAAPTAASTGGAPPSTAVSAP
jgi:pilus assembly protein CpaD